MTKIKLLENNEKYYKFEIMSEEIFYNKDETKIVETKDYKFIFHKNLPTVCYQKRWVGKYNWYLGTPEYRLYRENIMGEWVAIKKSPKGNYVTDVAGVWAPIIGFNPNVDKITITIDYNWELHKPYYKVMKEVKK